MNTASSSQQPSPDPDTLHHQRYPRSNRYEPQWVIDNQMGPHALWLMESLTEVMPIEPGMRVLDLGCGTAMTSIFLAKEFGAAVWAVDLWVDASPNQQRIVDAGVGDRVVPIHAEAHDLPFADGFFDAVVSVDAYQYFGTADLYLGYIARFLRPGGRIGIVVPSVTTEIATDVPPHLAPYWEWEFCCFHSPAWWRTHWDKTGKVRVDRAETIEDGWKDWLRFAEITEQHTDGWMREASANSAAMLRADRGEHLGFARIVATETGS